MIDGDHILDATAVSSFQVDSGFYGNHVSSAKHRVFIRAGGEGRGFVDIKSHTVTKAMSEAGTVARLADDASGDFVRISTTDALMDPLQGGALRRENGIVNLFHFLVGFSDDHGTGHVRAVAVYHCAEVHGEEACFQFDISRCSVGERGRLA